MSTLSVTTVNTANGTTDLTFTTGNTAAGKFVVPAAGGLVLSSNSTTNAVTIDTSGNVGIGTSSPTSKFQVNGGVTINGSSFPSSGVGLELAWDGTESVVQSYNRSTSSFQPLWLEAGSYTRFGMNGGEAMRIDSSGNVGIGTSSPSARLQVSSASSPEITIKSTASASWKSRISFGNTTAAKWEIGADIGGVGDNNLYFYDAPNGAERMRLDSSGNLLVGTTSTGGYSGSGSAVVNKQLTVGSSYNNATATDYVMTLCMNSSIGGVAVNNSATSGTNAVFRFSQNSSVVGYITTTNTATAYNTSSDYRLKENVAPMATGLATVAALKPVTYDWISDNSAGEGFLAHELQAVIPHAVNGEKDAVDEEGNIKPQGVDYSKIVVHLVAAIQELTARLAALEAK